MPVTCPRTHQFQSQPIKAHSLHLFLVDKKGPKRTLLPLPGRSHHNGLPIPTYCRRSCIAFTIVHRNRNSVIARRTTICKWRCHNSHSLWWAQPTTVATINRKRHTSFQLDFKRCSRTDGIFFSTSFNSSERITLYFYLTIEAIRERLLFAYKVHSSSRTDQRETVYYFLLSR